MVLFDGFMTNNTRASLVANVVLGSDERYAVLFDTFIDYESNRCTFYIHRLRRLPFVHSKIYSLKNWQDTFMKMRSM